MSEFMIQRKPAETQIEAVTPMGILQMAISQGADIDKLTKLMELQDRWEANEARKAFNVAMAKFKDNPPQIRKNKHVAFNTSKGVTEYDHATLDHVCDQITAALSKVGITHKWVPKQAAGKISVTCVLTHELGYRDPEPPMLEAPADESGGKNTIQSIGSTVTYLERYTLLAAVGMAAAGMDDDGKAYQAAAGRNERAKGTVAPEVAAPLPITNEQLGRIKDALTANKKKASAMYEFLGLKVGSQIPASKLQEALVWIGCPIPTDIPQAVTDAFTILDWDEYERNTYVEKHESRWDDILTSLNNMIDAENEK